MIPVVLHEMPEELSLAPTSHQRWMNFGIAAGLAALFGLIAVGSAFRTPPERQGVIWGSLLALAMLVYGFSFSFVWHELRFYVAGHVVVYRQCFLSSSWAREKSLHFFDIKTVRVNRRERLGYSTPEPFGRLQVFQRDGRVWAQVDFDDLYGAQRARKRILTLLNENSRSQQQGSPPQGQDG